MKALGEVFICDSQRRPFTGERGRAAGKPSKSKTIVGLLVIICRGFGGTLRIDQQPASVSGHQ